MSSYNQHIDTSKALRVLISGGGTGGHIFPALAIAGAIGERFPNAVVEFVGALGRMEMEKIPAHGYKIHGLWISGIQRKKIWKNFLLPVKVLSSMSKVNGLINKFKPDAVIGVGGYASGPLLRAAIKKGIPSLIQEQNSYPGITNKILAKKVNRICVAYPGMEKYFPADKLVVTGNPVRQFPELSDPEKAEAYRFFGLVPNKKTILVVGGSLGAGTINQSVWKNIDKIIESPAQLVWQTGKTYFHELNENMAAKRYDNIRLMPFIDKMNYAYAIADIVVSRAGAIAISELELMKKPTILVPSPNVAEDHQTKNAKTLLDADAAVMVKDTEASEKLVDTMLGLLSDQPLRNELSVNIAGFAKPGAASHIVDEMLKLIEAKK